MKINKLFIIGIVIALMLLPLLIYFLMITSRPVTETLVVNTNATVSKLKVGIDTSTLGVVFGKVPLNGTGKRFLNINNTKDFSQRIEFFVTGNISDFVYLSDNNFTLQPNESKRVDATFVSIEDKHPFFDEEIFYEGKIIATYTKV
jgi:hypothetical protein